VKCDNAISEAVDDICLIKIDSQNKEIELAIKVLEENTNKGLKDELPLRENEEVVLDQIKEKDIEFEESFCECLNDDLDNLNKAIISNMKHLKTGFEEKGEDIAKKLEDITQKDASINESKSPAKSGELLNKL
jgi:hypothetical protein